ncbi:DUF4118 domain-containing protein [Streptomyces sp. NPDC060194]|uniref:DUF4118 domain-containing protein n=1 Tax=Streptomyces sp. NPDC060194 TaxID=3347069 RepID=UPI003649E291
MRMPFRDTAAVAAALLAPLLAALALLPARTTLAPVNLALVLVFVVVAVAAFGNRWAGALAAVSAAAWLDFFHTEPYLSFRIRDRDDVELAVLMLVVGLVVSQIAARGRVMTSAAVLDAEHLERLHDTFRLVRSGGRTGPELLERIRQDLVDVLDLRECRFTAVPGPGGTAAAVLRPDGSLRVDGWIWDLERQGWPEGTVALPTVAAGRVGGRFLMTPADESVVPSVEARLVAADLACLAALVLDASGRRSAADGREDDPRALVPDA